jgi:hypothetical protein
MAPLVLRREAVLKLADELYERGCANGDSVDYRAFEERVARATAEVDQSVHQIALSGLDVDVPFIRVWGKSYRRVHRIARTYASLSGPVTVERTKQHRTGRPRSGCRVLEPLRPKLIEQCELPPGW